MPGCFQAMPNFGSIALNLKQLDFGFFASYKVQEWLLIFEWCQGLDFLEAIQIQNLVFTYVYPQISDGMKIYTTLFSKFVVLDENVRLLWKVKWCFHVGAELLKVSYILSVLIISHLYWTSNALETSFQGFSASSINYFKVCVALIFTEFEI